jgi:hypothetical protein
MSMTTTAPPEVDDSASLESTPPPANAATIPEPAPFSFIFKQLAVNVGLPLLAAALAVWNLVEFFMMAVINPRNDFGRAFCSTLAWVNGEDMYAANRSTPLILNNGIIPLWNLNPPHSHLLLLPLVWLDADYALAIWCVANAFCGLWSMRLIVQELGLEFTPTQRKLVIIGLLAFIGTSTAIITAHLSFVMFLLLTLAWRSARRGGWTAAGVWLGLALSIKPFLLFLVPYFLWNRRWKASAAIVATVFVCLASGFLVFGVQNHLSWIEKLRIADNWAWLPINGSLRGLLTRTFTANLDYANVADLGEQTVKWLWLAIGIPLGLASFAVAGTDSSRRGVDRAFAVLLVGSLLLSPLGWAYYFWMPLGPLAALVRDWNQERQSGVATSRYFAWRRWLLVASAVGFLMPLMVVIESRRVVFFTPTLGSTYCWSLLLLWTALVLDRWTSRRRADCLEQVAVA